MKIREYKPSDIEQVVKIWYVTSIQAHSFIPKEKWALHEDEVRNKYLCIAKTYVAEQDEKIVGFISLLDNFVGGLFIEPSRQGLGIGNKLIKKAMEDKNSLSVGVYKKNEKAQNFYLKAGFRYQNEEIQEETHEIVINMVKEKKKPDGVGKPKNVIRNS